MTEDGDSVGAPYRSPDEEGCQPDFEQFLNELDEPTDEEMYNIESDFDAYVFRELQGPVGELMKMTDTNELILSQLAGDILQFFYKAVTQVQKQPRKDMAKMDEFFDPNGK